MAPELLNSCTPICFMFEVLDPEKEFLVRKARIFRLQIDEDHIFKNIQAKMASQTKALTKVADSHMESHVQQG